MIENFIGFPAGRSGTELATRGVLQRLKFGAEMAAPVAVVGARNSAGQATMFRAGRHRTRAVHLLVRPRLGPGMRADLVDERVGFAVSDGSLPVTCANLSRRVASPATPAAIGAEVLV